MKNNISVLAVICTLLACSADLMAKERRGAELVITKTDRQQIRGELIAVKPSALLLHDSKSGTDLSVSVGDLRDIKIVKKPKTGEGLLIGLLTGSLAGGLTGALVGVSPQADDGVTREKAISILAILLGASGAAVGAMIGGLQGVDQTIYFQYKSPEQIKAGLEKLGSKARIREVQ